MSSQVIQLLSRKGSRNQATSQRVSTCLRHALSKKRVLRNLICDRILRVQANIGRMTPPVRRARYLARVEQSGSSEPSGGVDAQQRTPPSVEAFQEFVRGVSEAESQIQISQGSSRGSSPHTVLRVLPRGDQRCQGTSTDRCGDPAEHVAALRTSGGQWPRPRRTTARASAADARSPATPVFRGVLNNCQLRAYLGFGFSMP
jgi:hypothetical protein